MKYRSRDSINFEFIENCIYYKTFSKKIMGSKRLTFDTLSTAQIVKRQYTKLDLFIFSVRNTMLPNDLKIELSLTLHFYLYI